MKTAAANQRAGLNWRAISRKLAPLGIVLHPFARRLPPPTAEELEFCRLRLDLGTDPGQVKPGGWRGCVSFVEVRTKRDTKRHLLCGVAPFLAWLDSGRCLAHIPEAGRRMVEPGHALWETLEYVGEQAQWGGGGRARTAIAFAAEVKQQLRDFQSALSLAKGRGGETNTVLARLCRVSPREIAYALEKTKMNDPQPARAPSKPAVRSAASALERSGPRRALENAVVAAGGPAPLSGRSGSAQTSRVFEFHPVPLGSPAEAAPLADLAIMESERIGLALCKPWDRIKPQAVVVYLCDQESDVPYPAAEHLEKLKNSLSEGAARLPLVLRKEGILLARVDRRSRPHKYLWRGVKILTRADQRLEQDLAFDAPNAAEALVRAGELPGEKRPCRVRIYQMLMQAFCPGNTNVVFVPLYDELNYNARAEQIEENNSALDCLTVAAQGQKVRLVIFKNGPC